MGEGGGEEVRGADPMKDAGVVAPFLELGEDLGEEVGSAGEGGSVQVFLVGVEVAAGGAHGVGGGEAGGGEFVAVAGAAGGAFGGGEAEFGCGGEDQAEEFATAAVVGAGGGGDAAVEIDGDAVAAGGAGGDVADGSVELGDLGGGFDADVDAEDGAVGDDVGGRAGFHDAGVDGGLAEGAVEVGEFDGDGGCGDEGVAAEFEVAACVGGAASDDDGVGAGALAGGDHGAIGEGGLEDETGDAAAGGEFEEWLAGGGGDFLIGVEEDLDAVFAAGGEVLAKAFEEDDEAALGIDDAGAAEAISLAPDGGEGVICRVDGVEVDAEENAAGGLGVEEGADGGAEFEGFEVAGAGDGFGGGDGEEFDGAAELLEFGCGQFGGAADAGGVEGVGVEGAVVLDAEGEFVGGGRGRHGGV